MVCACVCVFWQAFRDGVMREGEGGEREGRDGQGREEKPCIYMLASLYG